MTAMKEILVAVCCLVLPCTQGVEANEAVKFMDTKLDTAPPDIRIVEGRPVKKGEFPYQAGIYLDAQDFCGGSLISNQWVLTSGHCVDGHEIWTVFLGGINIALPHEQDRLTTITRRGFTHPGYNSYFVYNDVGLIQFRRPIALNAFIQPVALYKDTASSLVGTTGVAAGFGHISDRSTTTSGVLRAIMAEIVDNSVCKNAYGRKLHESVLCASGVEDGSTCRGDSGSALVTEEFGEKMVIGVSSFNHKSGCQRQLPIGFAKVSMFVPWISEVTGITL